MLNLLQKNNEVVDQWIHTISPTARGVVCVCVYAIRMDRMTIEIACPTDAACSEAYTAMEGSIDA